jgi:hypothetical protein
MTRVDREGTAAEDPGERSGDAGGGSAGVAVKNVAVKNTGDDSATASNGSGGTGVVAGVSGIREAAGSGSAGAQVDGGADGGIEDGATVSALPEPRTAGDLPVEAEPDADGPAAVAEPAPARAAVPPGSGWLAIVIGLAATVAVVVAHLVAALRVDRLVATLGEGQLAAAASAVRGSAVTVDPLAWPDLLAARELAALQALLPADGIEIVAGARWACLVAGLLVALLLWPIQRSLGLSGPAAAAGMLVAGALPPTIAVHSGVTAAAPAALLLAVAAALVVREQGRGVGTVSMAAVLALVAVLTAPLLAAAVLALCAHAVIDRSMARGLSRRASLAVGVALGVLAVVAAVLAVGDDALASVGGPLLGATGAIGCALLGVAVLGVGWWRARWLRPLLSPAVVLLAVVLFVPGPARAGAAVLVIPVLALGFGVLVDDVVGRRWVAPALLVAVVASVLAAVLPAGSPPPAGPGVEALAAWARTEVDPAWSLRADALDRTELAAAGFPADRLRADTAPAGPDELLVVSDRPERGPLTCLPAGTLAAVDRGAGGVRTEVCPADAGLTAALTAERADRVRMGVLLADNPGVTTDAAAEAALRAGAVDSRLLVVLSSLSAQHRLGIEAFPTVPAADPAAPASTVRLSTMDGAPAGGDPFPGLRSWLGGQQPPFAPSVVELDGSVVVIGYPVPGVPGRMPKP